MSHITYESVMSAGVPTSPLGPVKAAGTHTLIQRTATQCNTLQRTATQCNTLQRTATQCNTLQRTATQCNTLQHTAPYRNTLQHTDEPTRPPPPKQQVDFLKSHGCGT